MSFEINTQHFDVVGPGFVQEHHANEQQRHLIDTGKNAVGGAWAWLAFYAVAVIVVATTNVNKAAEFVVASAN